MNSTCEKPLGTAYGEDVLIVVTDNWWLIFSLNCTGQRSGRKPDPAHLKSINRGDRSCWEIAQHGNVSQVRGLDGNGTFVGTDPPVGSEAA